MTEQQRIHIAMLNSYNVVMEKAEVDEILSSGIPMFAHVPNEDVTMEAVEFMIYYFKSHEMFEYCAALKEYINNNFEEDGTPKMNGCECELPEISGYTEKVTCLKCNKRIKP
jgi:hypothetical protein